MTDIVTYEKIYLRGDLASNWAHLNHILGDREPGYETDTGKLKVGDGFTSWNNLPYINQGSSSGVVTSFIKLTDVPQSYSGQVGKIPIVNSGETGLIFSQALQFSGFNKITVGTVQPSSPSLGDLWIDTN